MAREIKKKLVGISKWAMFCLFFSFITILFAIKIQLALALIQEATDIPPNDNLTGFLDIGPDDQVKRGKLGIGTSTLPTKVLDVNGPGYIDSLTIDNNFTVGTNNLFVDSVSNEVGIGTLTPATRLNVEGSGININSVGSAGQALATWSSGDDAIHGVGDGAGANGVQGTNNDPAGIGVWGYSNTGVGVFGESTTGSGVAGRITGTAGNAVYAANSDVINGWAGYFTGRVISKDNDVIGRRFLPEKLQTSLVPFTQGQELTTKSRYDLYRPLDLAYDSSRGLLWVVKRDFSSTISKVTPGDGIKQADYRLGSAWGAKRIIYTVIGANDFLWITNSATHDVSKFNPATGTSVEYRVYNPADVNCASVGQPESYYRTCGPFDLVYDGTYIWTSNFFDADENGVGMSSISKIDANTGNFIGAYSLPAGANYPAGITYDGTNIWTVNRNSNNITKFATDGTVIGTYPLTLGADTCATPSDITYDGVSSLWVSCQGRGYSEKNVYKINTAGTVVGAYYSYGSNPERITLDSITTGGPFIWTANYGDVAKLDLNGVNKFSTSIWDLKNPPTGIIPLSITTERAYTEGAINYTYIWTGDYHSYQLSKIKSTDGTVAGYFPIEGTEVQGLAFDGTYIWTADRVSKTIEKLRVSDGQKVGTYLMGTDSNPFYLTYDGQYIWVSQQIGYYNSRLNKVRASDGTILYQKEYTKPWPAGMIVENESSNGPYVWTLVSSFITRGPSSLIRHKISDDSEQEFSLDINTPQNVQVAQAMAYDGTYIWVIAFDDATGASSILRVDIKNCTTTCPMATTNLASGYKPKGILYDGKYIWTANSGNGKVSKWYMEITGQLTEVGSYRVYVDDYFGNPIDTPQYIAFDGTFIWVASTKRANNQNYLTILKASDGTVVNDNIYYASYLSPRAFVFDGTGIWLSGDYFKGLYKFYSGTGYGHQAIDGVVRLQNAVPGSQDTGHINVSGSAGVGNASVGANLYVPNNVWGGTDTNVDVTGAGTFNCPQGMFIKDIQVDGNGKPTRLVCRPL